MIEIVPDRVEIAFLYFHSARSSSAEIVPYLDELHAKLPHTYIWAGDGGVEGATHDPIMRHEVSYTPGPGARRFWFVFPMQGSSGEDFAAAIEPMGAVLATCGAFVNAWADQVMARFHLPARRVVLCGHQHGSCVALAAAMMRRADPFALTVLFDPWPLEALYLQHEANLPQTRVVCVDNLWIRAREESRGATKPLFEVFRDYGINASGVTLSTGEGKPDVAMFREAIRIIGHD